MDARYRGLVEPLLDMPHMRVKLSVLKVMCAAVMEERVNFGLRP